MTHGTENALQRRVDYHATEITALCERVLVLEQRLHDVMDRLERAERMLAFHGLTSELIEGQSCLEMIIPAEGKV